MTFYVGWHEYGVVSIAIIFSFFLTWLFFKTMLMHDVSQLQRLKFARMIFLTSLIIFSIAPVIFTMLPVYNKLDFHLQPLIKHASVAVKQMKNSIGVTSSGDLSSLSLISFTTIIIFILIVLTLKYIRNVIVLLRLTKNAFRYKNISRITIVFSESARIPFCWSLMFSSFVIIPVSFVGNRSDLLLAIRHELQHIRQNDTSWLHLLWLLKIVFFWNPFIYLWQRWFVQMQEFACDETLVLEKKISTLSYAQCLIDTAACAYTVSSIPVGSLGLSNNYQSILKRRISMLFQYKNRKSKKIFILSTYAATAFLAASFAFALNQDQLAHKLTEQELNVMTHKLHLAMTVEPEVIVELNNIRSSHKARSMVEASLIQMKLYKSYIAAQLKLNNLPDMLLALPFVESGYKPLDQSKNPMHAAGIWQFIPDTAKKYGLNIHSNNDERLNAKLETKAAIEYLTDLYTKYHDWKLAVIAYEYGDEITDELIDKTGTQDAWALARSSFAPIDLKQFLTRYESVILIINNPKLILG